MPHHRFFTLDPLENASHIFLKEKELQHLSQVMRGKIGDMIEIIDGKGWLAKGCIQSLQKQESRIEVLEKTYMPPAKTPLILACAIPLMNHLDFVLEKGTELGVNGFWLYPTTKSQSLSKERLPRLTSLLISAIKQSGQLHLPSIEIFSSLNKVPSNEGSYYFGSLENSAGYPSKIPHHPTILFIGPEGGYTQKEVSFLKENFKATGVKLGSLILRAETAALAGAALFAMLRDSSG